MIYDNKNQNFLIEKLAMMVFITTGNVITVDRNFGLLLSVDTSPPFRAIGLDSTGTIGQRSRWTELP
jgi:hypothetical protein